jgi:hypothetical protein
MLGSVDFDVIVHFAEIEVGVECHTSCNTTDTAIILTMLNTTPADNRFTEPRRVLHRGSALLWVHSDQ